MEAPRAAGVALDLVERGQDGRRVGRRQARLEDVGRRALWSSEQYFALPAKKPPIDAVDFEKVDMMKSTSSLTPSSWQYPRPPSP